MRNARERIAQLLRGLCKQRNILTIFTVLLVIGWFLTLRPAFLGGSTSNIIVSGSSMEPTMSDCDLAVLRKRDRYETGDVVAYRIPEGETGAGITVLHRIVGGSGEDGYITRGDNSDGVDRWNPRRDDVLGDVWFHVPNAGCIFEVFREPLVMALFAGLLAVLIVLEADRFLKR